MTQGRDTSGGPDAQEVARIARGLGRELDEAQTRGLAVYLELLARWNKRMNLVGARDWRSALRDLVADSWHVADVLAGLDVGDSPLSLDLGAGAGLPGLPLRLFWETGEYCLVEIRAKRVVFLRYALEAMELTGTFIFEGKAEDALNKYGPADIVLSRAFMPWQGFLGFVEGAVRGYALVMANEPPPETGQVPEGWSLVKGHAYPAGQGERYCWVFTPAKASRNESLSNNFVATSSAFSPSSMSRSKKSSSS